MDLEKLQVGSKVKYTTLCEAFGVEKKTGKSKQLQVKEFERYIKLEKEGTWFTILEIYHEPLAKIDGRTNQDKVIFKNGELSNAIIYTMSNDLYFRSCGIDIWHYNVMNLAEQCGLISEYHKHIDQHPEQLEIIGMTEASSSILNDFKSIKKQILGGCKILKESGVIEEYGYDIFICTDIIKDEHMTTFSFREPTDKEREIIAKCEDDTVEYFNNHKEAFNYKGKDLESYSKIYNTIMNPAIRSKLWNHCYDLCKPLIVNYKHHSRKLFIKASTDIIAQKSESIQEDIVDLVNSIYSARRVTQAQQKGEKTIKDMEDILNGKSKKSLGDVKKIREAEVQSKYGMTLDEAKELVNKTITMRNIAYTNKILDKLPPEDRQQVELYIDCILFKNNLHQVNKNIDKDLAILDIKPIYQQGYTYYEKQETLNLMNLFSTTETTVTESNCIDVGDYTFKQISELLKYKTALKVFSEYKYKNGEGWIDTYLIADEKYIKLITYTAKQIHYLSLLIAYNNRKTVSIGHIGSESKKLIKQLEETE